MKKMQKKTGEPRRIGRTRKIGLIVATAFASFLLIVIALFSFGKPVEKRCIVTIGNRTFRNVELADTPEKLVKGLSGREKQTMLFKFPVSGLYNFWMKDMRFALDLIWINKGMKVVGIEHELKPCNSTDDCERYEPPEPIMYVFELPAGTAPELRTGQNVQVKC